MKECLKSKVLCFFIQNTQKTCNKIDFFEIRKYIANIHNFLAVFMFDHYYFVLFMPPSLDHIRSVVKEELNAFDQRFKSAMKSRVYLLDKISYYIVRTKGKQFRPLITILCAKLFGNVNEKSYNAAVLVELLHTATLVHDDVVENLTHQRRGFFFLLMHYGKIK